MSELERLTSFSELAPRLAGLAESIVDGGEAGRIPPEELGQLMASIGRLYAHAVQDDAVLAPEGRNSKMTVTDAAIVCTALMTSVGLEAFELAGWQNMTGGLGSVYGRQAREK